MPDTVIDDTSLADLSHARVTSIVTLAANCWHVGIVARLPHTLAGQYIQLVSWDGTRRYFSLASRPLPQPDGSTAFELLISASGDENGTTALIAELQSRRSARIDGPFGRATLRSPASGGRYVFVSYDSGYAYVRGLLDALRCERPTASALFFRFSRTHVGNVADVYPSEDTRARMPVTCIHLNGRESWPTDPASFILNHISMLPNDWDINSIYIGGSRKRALALADDLVAAHVSPSQIISDHLTIEEQQSC